MRAALPKVVLLVLALHQVAQAAPPNTKSRTVVIISPAWPMFLPLHPPPPPGFDYDGPQSRTPQDHEALRSPPVPIPVSILVLEPTRSVASTVQGYLTQATGFVTSSVSSFASNLLPELPITINIPDIFTGVANRVTAAGAAVQTAWQNRPGNNPTAIDPPPDRLPDPDDELII